jgi:fibronectin-binding autotransporter adhesin
MKKLFSTLLILLSVYALDAQTNYYWNGATTTGSTLLGGTGSWTTVTTNTDWLTATTSGLDKAWPNTTSYAANFQATAGTVTMPNYTLTAGNTIFSVTGYTLISSGSSSQLTSPIYLNGTSINLNLDNNTNQNLLLNGSITSSAGLTGSNGITMAGNTFTTGKTAELAMVGTSTSISVPITLTLGTTASSNLVGIVSKATGVTIPGSITLNGTVGDCRAMLCATTGNTLAISGLISGTGDIQFSSGGSGGAGILTLSNTSNSFTGNLYLIAGTATFQASNGTGSCVPSTMGLYYPTGAQGGIFDINGSNVTIANLSQTTGTATGSVTNGGFTAATLTISQAANTTSSFALPITNGTGSATTALTLGAAGSGSSLTLSGANTFTGGLTLNANGNFITGAASTLASTVPVTFNGGTLTSGATTGNTQSVGAINLSASSTLALGTGSHSVTFSSLGTFTSGKTLTITGWAGTAGGSGTAGKVFIGSSASLTTAQLAQISFSGYTPGTAYQLTTGEIVPLSSTLVASLSPVSPSTGSETAGTTYTITVTTSGTTSIISTVAYSISGIQASQIASGTLTGIITIPSGSNTGSTTITVHNDNIYEGTETGTVSISVSTGSISTASSGTVTFALTDDATFYWNGGTVTPLTGPATGGSGTWSTSNAWIAPVNTIAGVPATWEDGYAAYLGGTAGTVSLSTSPSPSSISVNTDGYVITPSSSTTETLTGDITLATGDNLTLNDPTQTGTAVGSLRVLNLSGSSISGSSGSSITIGGGQGASTAVYSNVALVGNNGCTVSVPVIMNGTGAGGYVCFNYNAGTGTSSILSGGVQIANTNVATVVLGGTAGYTMTVNGITGSSSNTSPVMISNHPAGSGKGTFIYTGTSNYYGTTYLGTNTGGIVQCSVANSLSPNSVMTFGAPSTAAQGPNLDLGGANQTIGGLASLTGATGEINNSGTSGTATLTINQSTNTTFGLRIIDSTTGGKTAVVKSGSGTLTITGLNTFTGGLTLTAGIFQMGASGNLLANTLPVTFNGGTFNTGPTAGYSETVGAFNLSDNSTISLGTGSHVLTFNSLGTITSGKTLTITGWQGTSGSSGTAGQIFIGSSIILSSGQLSQITFSGHAAGATQLSTGEIVPYLSSTEADLSLISPSTGSEGAGTTYTITVTTTSVVTTTSTVTYNITGIQASQLAPGSFLSGTITIPAGSSTGSITFAVQTDNIIEGTETGTVSISTPTGGVGVAGGSTVTFTLLDNVTYYWNGGTPANNPATGGTGTWSAANAWIAPVNDGTGGHHIWTDGYPAYLGGTAGTISLSAAASPSSISVNANNYIITSGTTTAETLAGVIAIAAGDNLTINDPTQTGTNGRTLTYTGSTISGASGSSLTIGGAQGASTTNYSYLQLQPSTSAGSTISVPVIMNGTGTGGYISATIDAGTGIVATLSGGVQIANTNVAIVVLGAKSGWSMIVNGITAGSGNTSPVLISNTPAGSGKGNFTFEGISNYYGNTYLANNAGTIVKCANANTLSPNSVMTFGAPSTAGQGADLDLAGFDQTIGGLSNLTGATGEITNSATSGITTLTVNQSANTTFGLRIIDSTLGAKNALAKSGTGTLTFTGLNTFTGGLTLNAGLVQMGATGNIFASTMPVIFNGGIFSTGATTGYSETVGTIQINNNSSINLGTGVHTLKFSDSHTINWTSGKTLTIYGWQGSAGTSGTAGQIFVGIDNTALTTAQLDQITFNGFGSPGAIQLTTGEIVPASATYVWTGATNTSWTTITNWTPTAPAGGPHSCLADVTIPVTINSPTISAATSIGDITINDNAQLTLNGSLSVCGSLTGGTSTPPAIVGSSHLILIGTSAQVVSGLINANYLEVDNTSGGVSTSTAANVTINKGLILTQGNFTALSVSTVTLVSNASGDAYLDDFTSGTAGTYTGNLTVQRYISNTADGYRDLSAPVLSTVSDLNAAYPVTGQNSVECWYAYSPYPNLQYFNETLVIPSANGNFFMHWLSYTSLSHTLPSMFGVSFRTYVGSPYTIGFTGNPYTGPRSATITHTTTVAPANDGWNLLGNPYPSPIKWTLVKAMNAAVSASSYYIYNTTAEYAGNWGSFNGTTGVNGATDEISSSQGFFVQTANASTNFVMDNTVRTILPGTYQASVHALDNEVRLSLSNGSNSDEIVTYTDADATDGYDASIDAVKMPAGSAVYISYSLGGQDYAINAMSQITVQTVLPLTIAATDTGSYTLTATTLNTAGLTAYLRDAQTGILSDLSQGAVRLALNGGQTYSNRYSVVFQAVNTTTGITTTSGTATQIYSYGDRIYVKRNSTNAATISVTNLLGQDIKELNTNSNETDFSLQTIQPWYAIVKVTEGSKVTVAKVLLNNK